jgi:hypothetical protein
MREIRKGSLLEEFLLIAVGATPITLLALVLSYKADLF